MSSSSQLFMASEAVPAKAAMGSEPTGAVTPKSTRGRKPSAKAQSAAAKKPPQRGVGVAQLERLRLQERWKKMTEMPSAATAAAPPPPPLDSVPVQYGAVGYGGAAGRLVLAGGQFGSPAVVMDHGNGLMVDPRSYHHNHNHNHDHQYQRIRVDHDHQHLNQTAKINHNTSLTSDDSFDICSFKKKRFNGEINGSGLNLYGVNNTENNINIPNNHNMNIGDHLTLGFGTPNSKVPRSSLDHPDHEGHVEVVAVHRKGISSDHQDHVVMEYRFFPGAGKNDVVSSSSGTGFKKIHEKIWPTEIGSDHSVGELELEASYNYTNHIGVGNCNPLDLSLKL